MKRVKVRAKDMVAAAVLILFAWPLSFLGDMFLSVSNELHELAAFVLRWMEFWTGLRRG